MVGTVALDDFIDAYVDSFTSWDILNLYGTDSSRLCAPKQIAQLVGRPEASVRESLDTLVAKGFFQVEEGSDAAYYHWKPTRDLAQQVDAFVEATSDRRGRLRALSVLLRKLGAGATDRR